MGFSRNSQNQTRIFACRVVAILDIAEALQVVPIILNIDLFFFCARCSQVAKLGLVWSLTLILVNSNASAHLSSSHGDSCLSGFDNVRCAAHESGDM